MPYTLAQLKFLGLHLGIVIPPELLEKKREAEGAETETPESETQQQPDTSAQAKVSEKRKGLLDALAKLVDPPFAGAEALAALKSDRETATGALSGESPTPEQFDVAEKAIAGFGEKVEIEKKRVEEQRKNLLDAVSKLIDPPFAGAELLGALKSDRETATGALSAELPTAEQLQAAEKAIADFGNKVEDAKKEVSEKRKSLLDAVSKLTDPPFAVGEALGGLKSDREAATGALSAEFPTAEQFETAQKAIAAFGEKLEAEKKRVAEKRKGLLDAVSKLTDPPFAGAEALGTLKTDRETAAGALSGEFPTPEQFQAAEQAMAAFAEKVELEKTRVGEKRKALLDEVPKLTDPPYASAEALGALKSDREAAAGALTAELPTPAQLKTAADAIAAFAQKVEAEKKRVGDKRKALLDEVPKLTNPAFADTEALAALKTDREIVTGELAGELPTPDQLKKAEEAIAAFAEKVEKEKQRVIARKATLRKVVDDFAHPVGAEQEEKDAMDAECEKIKNALKDEAPTPADLKKAEKAIAKLTELIKQSKKMGAFAAKNPAAATEARKAFKDFRAAMLDEDVTPEVVAAAKQKLAEASQEYNQTLAEWKQLGQVPNGETNEQKIARETRREEVASLWRTANTKRDTAIAREKAVLAHEKAVLCEKMLTEATDHGPLSGDTGRPFKAATATKLVKAFAKDPKLASSAVKAATTAKYPDALADSVDKMIDIVDSGFQSGDGTMWPNSVDYCRDYGEKLLRAGGELGGDFFSRLPDYIASGKQFDAVDLGDNPNESYAKLAQKRSVMVAEKLVKPDGSIDVTTADAKAAIGNMLFHPSAMLNTTPALNAQMLKTVKFFEDPVSGPLASNVLKATVKPTDGGAQKLVRRALGKGDNDPVSDAETRTSVLAAMLKPLQQGPVGSCFSTAPTRRMRETKPLDAMKAYSDIACKGVYKPKYGVEVPVITNAPPDEDPLQRSFEYTLATSAVRDANSNERAVFTHYMAQGTDQMKTIVGGNDMDWALAKAKLKREIKGAFTFTYDPLSKVTDANDGSSSQGRYIIKRVSSGTEITTKDEFIKNVSEVAVKTLGFENNPAKATEVKDLVKSDAFINAVCPGKYKPWELASGGQTIQATKTLMGDTLSLQTMLGKASTTPKPPEGERTAAVLNSFLNSFSGRTDEMITVATLSMHGFNALPNHPSLADLKGTNPTETAAKVQTNLVDKGQDLKNTDLTAERAGWLFDQELKKSIDAETDPTLKAELEKGAKAKRPTAAMKPADLARAVKEAADAYHDLVAEKRANDWKSAEENATPPRPVTDIKLSEKKTKIKGDFAEQAEIGAKSLLIRDMGAPEFVIADTNWGSCNNHTVFVICPDPTTGEPLLWKKVEPPGSLRPAGREWVDDDWAHIS